jgi:hypothetical protein
MKNKSKLSDEELEDIKKSRRGTYKKERIRLDYISGKELLRIIYSN